MVRGMPKLETDSPPRLRKSHLKTRTGCVTCKIRRVKCGEEKPNCLRCLAYGTSCSYVLPAQPKPNISRPRYYPLAPQVKALVAPSHFKFEIEDGYRYFETFRSKASFEILSHSSDIESLRLILLQAGASDASIRYGIAALGALQKTSEAATATIQYDNYWGESNRHQRNALKLYSRAIAHMKDDALQGNQDLRTILLACLVTLCFEAWTGNQELALQQMQTGIKLVQEWKTSPSMSTVEEDIVQVFDRLAIQVFSFATDKSSPACFDSLKQSGPEPLIRMPAKFNSLKEAGFYQSIIMRYAMGLMVDLVPKTELDASERICPFDSNAKQEPKSSFMEHAAMIDHTKKWSAAFEELAEILYKKGANIMISAVIMKMQVTTVYLFWVGVLGGDEMVYDKCTKEFEEIVELAEIMIRAEAEKRTSFCFDMGLIMSLKFTAQKCRYSNIRRKAIALMVKNPRREGVWDSMLFGKMMEWAMNIEEEFMENGHVPEWARIRGVARTTDLQKRTAMMSCQQRKSESSDELVTKQKFIRW